MSWVISLVQIHGNYCGPDWTHGRRMPASEYFTVPEVTPIDRLDRACQAHDKDCSRGGCSKKGDTALRNVALAVAVTSFDPLLRAKALSVAAAMDIVRHTRSR